MSSFEDVMAAVEEQGAVIHKKLDALDKEVLEMQKKANRPPAGGDGNHSSAEYKQAFNHFLRTGDDASLVALQRKAMSSQSDPDGGVLVLPEMEQAVDRVAPTVSAMYRLADVKTISTAKYQRLVKTSGMSMRRVADGTGGGETTAPKYSQIEIEVHSAEVEPWVNAETLEDAFTDLENDLANEAAIGFAEGAGAEFITGSTPAQARGILSYTPIANTSYAWGKIGYVVSGKSAAFASSAPADAIVNLVGALPTTYHLGAAFLMNAGTLNEVRQMKDGSGTYYLWQPDPTAPFGGKLLGYPVEVDDNMPDISAGSYSIAFGNFQRGYCIVNRTGMTVIRDPYTSKGVVKLNFRRRFGGGVVQFEAIKLMRFATS